MDILGQLSHMTLQELYGPDCDTAVMYARFTSLLETHKKLFSPKSDDIISFFSTPGRTELGGNHTDHNHGRVLAASIHLDTIGAVAGREDYQVILISEGYPEVRVDISSTEIREEEKGTTEALVRGIAEYFRSKNIEVKGFQANTTSNVLKGSGLSSSAAVEVLIGTIFNELYADGTMDPVEIAKAGQFAENRYFGKPSGLMDQIACACGGIAAIDFKNPAQPQIETLEASFRTMGYILCVVDTGGNHADLTPEYAAIPKEMRSAAQFFGQEHLRGLDADTLVVHAKELRESLGDRAWLRAMHFVLDNQRVPLQANALRSHDIERYLNLVRESGRSSCQLLQNIYPASLPEEQGVSAGLAMTELFLSEQSINGACRVHGGGFAGTIQAYIPVSHFHDYIQWIEQVFGNGSVTPLTIRSRRAGCVAAGYPA